jgi:hypothetical protein
MIVLRGDSDASSQTAERRGCPQEASLSPLNRLARATRAQEIS